MRAAAAQVTVHVLNDFFPRGMPIFQQKSIGGDNHSRRAVATLESVMIEESFLDRVQASLCTQAFDRQHMLPGDVFDRSDTRPHGVFVHDDCAVSTECFAATELHTGEAEVVAQDPEQLQGGTERSRWTMGLLDSSHYTRR